MDCGTLVKRPLPRVGPIDDLIDEDEIAGVNVFAERSRGPGGDEMRAAEFLEGEYVGAIGNRSGVQHVPVAMPLEDGDMHVAIGGGDDCAAGATEGGFGKMMLDAPGVDAVEQGLAESAAGDDADCHGVCPGVCHGDIVANPARLYSRSCPPPGKKSPRTYRQI